MNSILRLQRTIGNQAVQRLLQHAQPDNLEVSSGTTAAARFGHDFSRIPVHSKSPINIQAKLTVNTPGDIYEQEANRISEQVMRMPEPHLQRACACGGFCPKCRKQEGSHAELQTKRVQASEVAATSVPPVVRDALRSPGQPLDSETRATMQPHFGYDLNSVQVHTDSRAARSAHGLNAFAYTIGNHIVFANGAFAPATTRGRHLLAHELAHVVQQAAGNTGAMPAVQRKAGEDAGEPGAEAGNAASRFGG